MCEYIYLSIYLERAGVGRREKKEKEEVKGGRLGEYIDPTVSGLIL